MKRKQAPLSRRFLKNKKRTDCKGMPKESVEEFLDRGGEIQQIDLPGKSEVREEFWRQTSSLKLKRSTTKAR